MAHGGPGRPRVYCSRTCRQAAANARAGANVAPRVVTIERVVERIRTVKVKDAPEHHGPEWWAHIPADAASWTHVLDQLWAQLWLYDLSTKDRIAISRQLRRINRELRTTSREDRAPVDPQPWIDVHPEALDDLGS